MNCSLTEPVTDVVSVSVVAVPVPLTSVDLTLVTTGTIHVGDFVDFSADLLPDNADKPYTFTIDFGDSSPVFSDTSILDPLSFTHAFLNGGTYTVVVEAWNASNTEPVTDSLDLTVYEPVTVYSSFLPLVTKTGTPQGLTNQMQKGLADHTPSASFLALPLLFSAMLSLPVIKKLR